VEKLCEVLLREWAEPLQCAEDRHLRRGEAELLQAWFRPPRTQPCDAIDVVAWRGEMRFVHYFLNQSYLYRILCMYIGCYAVRTHMNARRVGIVGGGPGGLVLARILHVNGVDAVVYEREPSFTYRSQGGSLDIHADSGQIALAQAGLTEAFQRIARYEDQETRLYDKHGVLRLQDTDVTGKDRPEVDRGHLRQMLLESLPQGVVRWSSYVRGVEPQADGTCDVVMEDGMRQRYDLVVGADGTWSKVRPAVSDAAPEYSGVVFAEMGIDDVDRRYPDTSALVGRGLGFALGDAKGLIVHRDSNAHLGFYAAFRGSADVMAGKSDAVVKAELLDMFADWGEGLKDLIRRADDVVGARGIYSLPEGHRWKHVPGVTLLGDAAHVFSPFSGDGANFALLDGAELAAVLLREDWREALPVYEAGICARAGEVAPMANGAMQTVFAEGGLEHSVRMFSAHM
jgi:2-polyprenyl-6-methoxyphenol hydroxylase-like FAD-dependent oxidoreductase